MYMRTSLAAAIMIAIFVYKLNQKMKWFFAQQLSDSLSPNKNVSSLFGLSAVLVQSLVSATNSAKDWSTKWSHPMCINCSFYIYICCFISSFKYLIIIGNGSIWKVGKPKVPGIHSTEWEMGRDIPILYQMKVFWSAVSSLGWVQDRALTKTEFVIFECQKAIWWHVLHWILCYDSLVVVQLCDIYKCFDK